MNTRRAIRNAPTDLGGVIRKRSFFKRYDPATVDLPPEDAAIAEALRHNVLAVSRSVSLPWRMRRDSECLKRWDDFPPPLYPTEGRAAQAWNMWVQAPGIDDAIAIQ